MIDRLAIPAQDLIEWEFQVEHQNFIARYGTAGGFFYKQVVLQSGAAPHFIVVRRISEKVYEITKRIAAQKA